MPIKNASEPHVYYTQYKRGHVPATSLVKKFRALRALSASELNLGGFTLRANN
jgi:hypothetical protein